MHWHPWHDAFCVPCNDMTGHQISPLGSAVRCTRCHFSYHLMWTEEQPTAVPHDLPSYIVDAHIGEKPHDL